MNLDRDKKIELCASKDGTRPHLCAPYLDAVNGRLVATDGARLVSLQVVVDGDESGYVPVEALKAARRIAKKGEPITLALGKSRARVSKDGSEFPRPDLGQFPPYEKVIPDEKSHKLKIGFNAKYLYEIAQALDAEDMTVVLSVDPRQPLSPIVVRGHLSRDDELGVLMPCRV